MVPEGSPPGVGRQLAGRLVTGFLATAAIESGTASYRFSWAAPPFCRRPVRGTRWRSLSGTGAGGPVSFDLASPARSPLVRECGPELALQLEWWAIP